MSTPADHDDELLEETVYLLSSPANARRLLGAIDRLESRDGTTHDLADDGDAGEPGERSSGSAHQGLSGGSSTVRSASAGGGR